MKFELQYTDNSVVVVFVDDVELQAWLRVKAESSAANVFQKQQQAKGSIISLKVVA